MQNWRKKWYRIIFESDTPAGKLFDVILLIIIIISIFVAIVGSVPPVKEEIGEYLQLVEWIITVIFTLEYFIRIWVVRKPITYLFSFYGIIDFLSILPSYLGLFVRGTESLIVIRALRLLRVFRILKLGRYSREAEIIKKSLQASRIKISVFLFAVITLVTIVGTIMYLIEGPENGFTSIPKSIYWTIVTITTVGYGDIAPQTTFGQVIASIAMIIGYAIIAVPTGIVTSELLKERKQGRYCSSCQKKGHEADAIYCKYCGEKI